MCLPRRHPVFYYPKGTHIFRVENTLYKLHDDVLVTQSGLFHDMFSIGENGHGDSSEGTDDDSPIILEGEHESVFNLFLADIYGPIRSHHNYSHEELRSLLHFIDKYRCPKLHSVVVDRIWDKRYTYHPAELVEIGRIFKDPKIFKRGFDFLLRIPIREISGDHRRMIGYDAFIAFVYAKAVLEDHCKLIATREPVILAHAKDCRNPAACREDWHAVWWNGMGRFLLDAVNPQTFTDAVTRFREMQFGRMGVGCRQQMLQLLDDGVGFRHADILIADVCQGLVDDLKIGSD
ncbi:hypothetical protein J3R83DRAFT_8355 [Lanmaoa asiatica]|nr:hypothetical protein J3R83DRAFT_8355 [Lanmaoa asiatica]